MRTVLVVEDNEAAREGMAAALRREGFQVVLAADGEQALSQLRGGLRPDLILLDMLMPVLDGWHFLSRLKEEGPQPSPPIIIATATILTREWAADHGCQGCLRKPFDTEQLMEEIRRCLPQPGTP